MASNRRASYLFVQDENVNLVEHFEQVQCRVEEVIKHAKKRVGVDKDHVKALQKMTQMVHDDSQVRHLKFDGPLEAHWSKIKEQLSAEAMHVSRVTSTLEQQALQPLQVFLLTDLEKRFHGGVQDGRRIVKEYVNARAMLQKARDKYYSSASEWQTSLLAIFREYGDTWNPSPGNKLHEKEMQLCKRMEECKAEYESTVDHVNTLQNDIFVSQLPEVLDSLRNVAENMVAVVNNALKSFSDMQRLLVKGDLPKEGQQHALFDAAEYCRHAIFNDIAHSSIPLPPKYEFQDYPFQDETLMIQTRKVQYQCMSKLSAKELVNRAHQFVADGDKRSQSTGKHITASAGTNRFLVSVCLEYLQQPISLKEEGLFRVSGDAAIIKSLHDDFVSGRATKEFLRAAVTEQRDPNTVSGLLKMHLRQNPFLSARSAEKIEKAIAGEKNELLSNVILVLSSSELGLLTDISQLLHTIVQQPWCAQNKMTPHTLGIACGLSLFPQLNPSKATVLTQEVVTKYEVLRQSHTFL